MVELDALDRAANLAYRLPNVRFASSRAGGGGVARGFLGQKRAMSLYMRRSRLEIVYGPCRVAVFCCGSMRCGCRAVGSLLTATRFADTTRS